MLQSLGFLFIAMLSIQFGASQAKQLFPELGPIALSALRIGFAAIILSGFLQIWKKPPPSFSKMKWIFLYGASLGLMNLTFYLALGKIPLGVAVALEFIGPLGIAILFSKGLRQAALALMASAGVLILTPASPFSKDLDPWGVFWALSAGLFWGLYILFGKKAAKDQEVLVSTTYGMIFAFFTVLPFALTRQPENLIQFHWWPEAILIALLGSAIPYSLEMKALKNLSHQTFGILMSFEPVMATLMGLIFLKETLSFAQTTGILFIVLASLGATLQRP